MFTLRRLDHRGGDRWPTENELAGARWQEKHVALLAGKLGPGRKEMLSRLGQH